jgi:nicotinate dehydrogenase subunit B
MTARGAGLPVSRRDFLAGSGALIVNFALRPALGQAQPVAGAAKLPGSLDHTPLLDAWIRVDADGGVTVFTGKVELGQGIKTALIQIAAEQLGCAPARLRLVTADTARTPDEGFTSGSHSLQDSGTAILHAAAQVREILLARAAERWAVGVDRLKAENGAVLADDGRRLSFGELVSDELTRVRAQPDSKLKDPRSYTVMGTPLPRVDIPAKVSGGVAYVQDLRLPGMVHARVVRPPSYGARLRTVASEGVQKLPGVLKVVRDGSYLALIAEREYQAVVAMRALAAAAAWDEQPSLPAGAPIYEFLRRAPAREIVDLDRRASANPGVRALEASYRRPYQLHGAIGPSCAIGWLREGNLTVWTHTQGVYPLRRALAEMLQLPLERVRCIHVEGAGCYGHNGADDAAADAALLARALPDRPVRVQWMREQEHLWEPYGPAMLTEAKASLDAEGRIVSWEYDVWSNTHSTRPGTAGSLMPTWHLATPFTPPEPAPIPLPEGGGDRNAIPLYVLPNARVVQHFIPAMPRASSTSWRARPAPIRWSSGCATSTMRGRARSSPPRRRASAGPVPPGPGVAARALPLPATRTSALIWRSRSRSRSSARPGASGSRARWPRSTAARPSIPTACAIRSKAASCRRRAGRCTKRSASTRPGSPAPTGAAIRSCVFRKCPTRSRCTSSIGRGSRSSAPAKPPRGRRPRHSPTR